MLHLFRVPEDNEHAMHLHRVASGSSKLTGNAGDVPGSCQPSRRLRRLARARRARGGSQRSIVRGIFYFLTYLLSSLLLLSKLLTYFFFS
jgi:hypothetical protein